MNLVLKPYYDDYESLLLIEELDRVKFSLKVQTFNYETRSSGLEFLIVYILRPYLVYDLKFNNPVWN